MTKHLLIAWWSLTGASEQLARAAAEGAREAAEGEVEVRLLRCDAAGADDLLAADGVLFAAPENLASLAGRMKDFFDRSYYGALGRIEGRPYALIVAAGSDGQGAARQVARICTGWRLQAVAPPLIVITHAQTPETIFAPKQVGAADLARAGELGGLLAAGLAAGVF